MNGHGPIGVEFIEYVGKLKKGDDVLEVGPGQGNIVGELLKS
jgi:16S rRNA A1518/A1519 N6-dimethyltransferase RsmA/KsgA/DIM1 with predicted DNA glycosylase/AP lyase activity